MTFSKTRYAPFILKLIEKIIERYYNETILQIESQRRFSIMKKNSFFYIKMLAISLVLVLSTYGKSNAQSMGSPSGSESAAAVSVPAMSPEADFNVTLTEDGTGVVITRYTGGGGVVNIPTVIQGMPVREIGNYVFRSWTVGGIGTYVRTPAALITSVIIPEGVTKIGYNAFSSSDSGIPGTRSRLTSIIIPGTVTEIGTGIFRNCTALKTVTLAEGVPVISDSMFDGCSSLTEITIPSSVTQIGEYAFRESGIRSINWPARFAVIPGGVLSGTNLTVLVIPEGVTEIRDGAFANCEVLTSVAFPSTIKKIGAGSFGGCSSLSTITIPVSVESIEFGGRWGLGQGFTSKLDLTSQAALRRCGYLGSFY
jgi:hypothetical protein